jgi:hypothetical protein
MLRWVQILSVCGPFLATGCGLVVNTARNAYNEPVLALDECRFRHKTRRLADEAWDQYRSKLAIEAASPDFRDGFLDGYVDYLRFGGAGEPKVLPPRRYQHVRYETPGGLRAVDSYFQGFQQGTQAAIASGQRQQLVVPVLVKVWADPSSVAAPMAPADILPPPNPVPPMSP